VNFSLAAQYHHEVTDHRGATFVVKMDDVFFRQFLQSHVHHTDSAVYDFLAGRDDGFGLLSAEHGLCDIYIIVPNVNPTARTGPNVFQLFFSLDALNLKKVSKPVLSKK